jgi:2-dehydro-3-deoxyphosphogalactonate aldolase
VPLETPLPPLVAILRGVQPMRAVEVGQVLYAAGVRAIEVPTNSPDPFDSIARLTAYFGDTCVCGAGTVLDPEDVAKLHVAGGRLVVSPNTDPDVIARARKHGMTVMPGFTTATEAFAAIRAGATHLKLFPASTVGPAHLKALKSVLPKTVPVYAVGGIGADDVNAWWQAGADGFGFGSELYKPDYTLEDIGARAKRLVEAVRGLQRR